MHLNLKKPLEQLEKLVEELEGGELDLDASSTCGRGKPQMSSGLATGARIFSISSARIVRRPRSSSCSKRRAAIASRIRFDAAGPRSDATSASSISSSVAVSSAAFPDPRSRVSPLIFSPSRSAVFLNPPVRRSSQLIQISR